MRHGDCTLRQFDIMTPRPALAILRMGLPRPPRLSKNAGGDFHFRVRRNQSVRSQHPLQAPIRWTRVESQGPREDMCCASSGAATPRAESHTPLAVAKLGFKRSRYLFF